MAQPGSTGTGRAARPEGAPQAPAGPRLSAGRWNVDSDRSTLGFRVKKMGAYYVKGRFRRFEGTVEARPDGQVAGEARIAADSISTRIPPRDAHLRGTQFLEVKRYPEIRFRAERTDSAPDGELRVSGTIEIHGVSAPIELRAHLHSTGRPGEPVRLHLHGTLDRHSFGIRPPQPFEMVVGNDVHLEVDLLLERAA